MIAESNSYWQNITCTGRIWLILTERDLYWQNLTSIGRIWLPLIYTGWLSLLLVEYDLYWQNITSIGRIWFILAYCHSYWQNMQPVKSVLPFCSALLVQYTSGSRFLFVIALNSLFSSLQMTDRSLCFGSVKVHAWQCCSIVVWRVHETRHSGVLTVFLPGWCHSNGSGTTRCHRGNMYTDSHHIR